MESVRHVSKPREERAPTRRRGEESLWARAARGDREAAGRLAEETYRDIYGALVKLAGDADLAADLTQETYRKAWAAIGRFDGRSSFSTWLYRIAYNTFLNHVRRPQRLLPMDERQASEVPDPEVAHDDRLHVARESERLRRAVLALPEELRFAVTARFWAELPVREIAQQQEISTVG